MTNGTPLRLCGGCNQNFLTWRSNEPGTDLFLCDDCKAKRPAWDPQPWAPPQIGQRLSEDCSLSTDKRRHRIVARDGDTLTVRRYLFPGLGEPITVHMSHTRPVVFGQ